MWRDFPALTNRDELKIHIPVPSSRFDDTWETRNYVGCAKDDDDEWVAGCPAWVKSAHELVRTCEFSSLGAACTVVDEPWAEDRFSREDATTYALCKCAPPATAAPAPAPAAARGKGGGGGGGRGGGRGGRGGGGSSSGGGSSDGEQVMAAAVITPFAAERILRSLTNADRETEVLYFDVICAVQTGAAYRLFCDVVTTRRRLYPERRLLVVLLSVVSADVLSRCARRPRAFAPPPRRPPPPPAPRRRRSLTPTPPPFRYARWGFTYGGIGTDGVHVVNGIAHLHAELCRFEASISRGPDPSPLSASRQPSTASAAAGRGSPPPAKAAARKRSG